MAGPGALQGEAGGWASARRLRREAKPAGPPPATPTQGVLGISSTSKYSTCSPLPVSTPGKPRGAQNTRWVETREAKEREENQTLNRKIPESRKSLATRGLEILPRDIPPSFRTNQKFPCSAPSSRNQRDLNLKRHRRSLNWGLGQKGLSQRKHCSESPSSRPAPSLLSGKPQAAPQTSLGHILLS